MFLTLTKDREIDFRRIEAHIAEKLLRLKRLANKYNIEHQATKKLSKLFRKDVIKYFIHAIKINYLEDFAIKYAITAAIQNLPKWARQKL